MTDSHQPTDSPTPATVPAKTHKWRRRLKWLGILSGIGILLMGGLMGAAEYYTAKPEFCGSCHIMDQHYTSWQKDPHSEKADAACVDCHYAPGEHHTIMAKFRGLSQVATYFSGRAGASRPRARVNDASCLTSGCHGDGKYLDTELTLGNVRFTHAKHLDPQGKIAVENQKKTAQLRRRLLEQIGPQRMAAIDRIAEGMQPAAERNEQLAAWAAGESLAALQNDIFAYGETLHTDLRLKHLEGLKCSSCHQFNTSLNTHFKANLTTCYTCHFLNQPFNTNSGRCLTCHNPPSNVVAVHGRSHLPTATQPTTTGPVVMMDHATILANNVSCIGCHTELIHGTGQVTRRDCLACHDQDTALRDFDHLTTAVVTEYHRVHAAGQRARCNECHQVIEHRLTPIADPRDAVALLSPVRADCQHCHPDHHREQVQMLIGQGGFVDTAAPVPNQMTGSRANCRACHVKAGEDPKQEAVIVGTLESCRGCHSEEYEQLFRQWQQAIGSRLKEAQDLLTTIEQRLSAASRPRDATRQAAIVALVQRARENIHFVSTANGIHNKNYALMLLDQAVADLEQAGRELAR